MSATLIKPEPVASAYIGFRHWHVKDGRLFSINPHPLGVTCPSGAQGFGRVEWPVEGITARPCRNGPAPAFDCSCGVYATRHLLDPGAVWRSAHDACRAIGAVALWGLVVEHETGYRAQHARPVALLKGNGAQRAADVYGGVPLLSPDELVVFAALGAP